MGTVADLKRSKPELIAENMFLRQQLIVLERQVKRPKLTQRDRQILVLLASRIAGWREALVAVKPDTLLDWHREVCWPNCTSVRNFRLEHDGPILSYPHLSSWAVFGIGRAVCFCDEWYEFSRMRAWQGLRY
jgi:hypothetical protein